MPSGFKKYLTYVAVGLLLIYISIGVYLHNIQERALFPAKTIPITQSLGFSLPHQELFLTAQDGAILSGVYFSSNESQGVVLYFHGNRENLLDMQYVAKPFVQRGYDFLAMDYRTYGKSTGELSEENLFSDATLFWNHLKGMGWQESDIVIYGRSIGTGIATELAARTKPRGLLLYSPYYSIPSLISDRFALFPVRLILSYTLNSGKNIQDVNAPILILHGDKDRVIPLSEAQKLAAIKGKLVVFEGGGHGGLQRFPLFWQSIERFFDEIKP